MLFDAFRCLLMHRNKFDVTPYSLQHLLYFCIALAPWIGQGYACNRFSSYRLQIVVSRLPCGRQPTILGILSVTVRESTHSCPPFSAHLSVYSRQMQVKAISIHIKLEHKRVGKFCIDLFHY